MMTTENMTFENIRDGVEIFFEQTAYPLRVLIGFLISVVLVTSLAYRSIIFKYLSASTTSQKSFNFIFWCEQLSQLSLIGTLVIFVIILISPIALDQLIGNEICKWVQLPSGIYVTGVSIWSCLIAVCRLTIFKMPKELEQQTLAAGLVTLGIILHATFALILFNFDNKSIITRMCFHGKIIDEVI